MPNDPAREQLNDLLGEAVELAQSMIETKGAHIPFAVGINRKGERAMFSADTEETQDMELLSKKLLDHLEGLCVQRELTAVAFARNVQYSMEEDGPAVDAIEISLDHVASEALTCYLAYTLEEPNRFVPGEMYATDPRHLFFGPLEV